MKKVKQVILVRTDLSMDKGKAFSQVSHASMKFLADKIREASVDGFVPETISISLNEAERLWLEGKFIKIVLGVSSEAELLDIHKQCEEKNISVALIVDDGTTVFGGVSTPTCLGIGPAFADEIDPLTRHLRLYKEYRRRLHIKGI